MTERHPSNLLGHETFGYGQEWVFVLHDFFSSLRTWDPVRPYLAVQQFRFVFADVRGYGTSRRLRGRFDAEEVSTDLRALADHYGAERYHLIGHSMTGLAVQHALVDDTQRSSRVERAVAVTPVPTNGFLADEQTLDFFRKTVEDDEALRHAVFGLTGQRWGRLYLERRLRMNRETSSPDVMRAYLERLVFKPGLTDAAKAAQVQTPLLVVAGAHDFSGMKLGDVQSSMDGAFPAVEWVELAEAGHYPMDESPVALAHVIQTFLAA